MLVKGDQKIEAGVLPDPQLFSDMANYNNELKKPTLSSLWTTFNQAPKASVSYFRRKIKLF